MKLGKREVKTPAVCGAVIRKSVPEMRKAVVKGVKAGADAIELRIDGLRDQSGWESLLRGKVPIILTNRARREGGFFAGSERARTEALMEGVGLGVSCVDVEFSTSQTARGQILKRAKSRGVSTIVSHHDFSGTPAPAQLIKITEKIAETGCDIAKVVTLAKNRGDAFRMLDFIVRTRGKFEIPVIAFAMNEAGKITRFIGPIFGVPIVYAAVEKQTAPGQLDVAATKAMLKELMPREVRD
jgi:3-dehydroquinate dehydratase type I